MDKIRLNKYIANCGICSRRQADKYILEERVSINNEIVAELGVLVDVENDKVRLNGSIIRPVQDKKYIIMNKPVGYITTSKEQFNRPYVLQLIKEKERVFPIGRLDMQSEGLIILTNDGDFANEIMHPTKHIEKEYEVTIKNKISHSQILTLEKGVDIGGYVTQKSKVVKINDNSFRITIKEGKNRQIRRMCETIGHSVIKLKRIRIGYIYLEDLKEGEYKYIDYQEAQRAFN